MMLRLILVVLIVIGGGISGALAQPTYLRCQYTEPLNQRHGRYVIVMIDLTRHTIELHDHHEGGTTVINYLFDQIQESFLTGIRVPKVKSDEWIEIDRVSGRVTIKTDATADADKLWNEAKRQFGGFDTSDGKKVIMTATLNCQRTKPIM